MSRQFSRTWGLRWEGEGVSGGRGLGSTGTGMRAAVGVWGVWEGGPAAARVLQPLEGASRATRHPTVAALPMAQPGLHLCPSIRASIPQRPPRAWKGLSAAPRRLSASQAVASGRMSAALSSGLAVKGSAAFQAVRQAASARSAWRGEGRRNEVLNEVPLRPSDEEGGAGLHEEGRALAVAQLRSLVRAAPLPSPPPPAPLPTPPAPLQPTLFTKEAQRAACALASSAPRRT
jgi:hypothetical protein